MDYMKQALSLAKLALGQVSPNPAVGAIVVRDSEVVGQGYTQPPGSQHAEVMALNQAEGKTQGSTMYVTLEPCRHQGRTDPCTQSIIDAGVTEVHLAMLDPNPLMSGRGEDELAREGVKTFLGEHEEEARDINEAYIKFITTGMPFVTVKFAASLDGKIATKSGDSQWISGSEARKYVHYLRYTTDAIMAGANTVIVDNPRLTCRYAGKGGEVKKQPLRVIVDGRGRTPPLAQVFNESGKAIMALAASAEYDRKQAFSQVGTEVLELPSQDGMLDLKSLLEALGERDVTSVLVEGGGILLGSLFDYGLVDKVIAFVSPVIIGGEESKTPVAGKGIEKVMEAHKLERISLEKFGEDFMISGYVNKR
ncbi:MAG: bifunctional diaminohydroxyphosphoribosylaminopyrimidine deaminase/5-amino-6-(5-phosphoribosylamino)uracil reductase RibD [Dehalococcoidales bacterium]|jgi:diaminohydroxyphosphoribosylaminopyrimidine deaminase/5-amino-6-(5-phosphoribosylamino)uracil reductase|nr:bifunctional diaminohydroxyphosphoribosylaminopyrimidine deaminase/5-amino-6-(5-phosphoribosylamino)uracil reductase RibD [Dehalococcoidales bacterium]